MGNNVALGAQGEDLAAEFLTAAGMTIVDRNWRTRYGEIDLIVRSNDVLVFVEVKTRTGRRMGVPAEAVTLTKQRRIRRLAAVWLAEQSGPWTPVRFDVVSVLIESGTEPVIEHLEAVF